MKSEFSIFVKTLQIGEKVLDLSYTDYEDAFEFSNKCFSQLSHHFIDFFENHSDRKKGEYEYDLIRYFFIKAIENRIASDIFSETSRGNMCDVFHSPFDIDMAEYPANLPYHLEKTTNSNQSDGYKLADAIVEELDRDLNYSFGESVLNAIMFLGHTIGHRYSQENLTYYGYSCSEMLTRNEINSIAGDNLCKWLNNQDYEIGEANFTRDTYQNIVARKDCELLHILISAEITPIDPVFIPLDIDNLYNAAHDAGAVPYYASVSLGSVDQKHLNDGVLLYGDQIRYRVNAFVKLEQA